MTRQLSCCHGHSWSGDAPDGTRCPVCGSEATSETLNQASSDFPTAGDSLPPAPGRQVQLPTHVQPDSRPEIPGFEILSELGRGGMGVVYRARQKSLDRIVALKMLLAGPLAGPDELARLRVEAESIARLQHPNIVHVYDIGEHKGWTYISLEFVEGGSLSRQLDGRPKSPDEAAELVETLARAVHAAHQRGIVHRDLKPANVLITGDGVPKVSDFGLAKRLDGDAGQTRSGAIMGTPSYMAPEQADGRIKAIGPRTDVYALGAILYELLTGRPPFLSDSAFEIMLHVVQTPPTPPSRINPAVPAALEAICLKCLAKEPESRYGTTLELANELKRFRTVPCETVLPRGTERHRPTAKWLAPVLACSAVVLVSGLLLNHIRKSPPDSSSVAAPSFGVSTAATAALRIVSIGRGDEKFDRLAFPSPRVGFAASRQAIYKSIDGGESWSALSLANPGRVHVMAFEDELRGWLGTDRLRFTADGGNTWSEAAIPDPSGLQAVTALAIGPNGMALAAGTANDGRLVLMRRDKANTDWHALDAATGNLGRFKGWYCGDMAFRGNGVVAMALFRGSQPGGAVLTCRDNGATWAIPLETDCDLYRIRFADAKRGWLAGSDGRFWTTADGGAQWTPIQPPSAGVSATTFAFAKNARFGVAPLWQGEVLVAADGESWRSMSIAPGFGYSMPAAHIFDDGTALVLSADGRLARFSIASQSP